MNGDGFTHWQEFIPKALRHYKLDREARASLICARFRGLAPEVVGPEVLTAEGKEVVRPKFFKGGVLYISVPSSVWAQRVIVHRHDLIQRLNAHLDKAHVKDVRTVVD